MITRQQSCPIDEKGDWSRWGEGKRGKRGEEEGAIHLE